MNPATAEVLTDVADADEHDARAALRAAERTQPSWSRTPARTRSEILYRAHQLMIERTEQLALLMTLEMGKPLPQARGEVAYAAEFFRWFAEEAVRVDGGYAHRPDGAARNLQVKQPVGPSLLIIPWNFPLAMGARKLGSGDRRRVRQHPETRAADPALLAGARADARRRRPPGGCAERRHHQPGRRRRPADAQQWGHPQTVVHRVHRGRQAAAGAGGAGGPANVDGARRQRAVPGAGRRRPRPCGGGGVRAKMRNMGEACTAANRFFVHAGVAEEFSARLAERMGALTVGDGTQTASTWDRSSTSPAAEKVRTLLDDAVQRGASVLVGGGSPPRPGYFVEPTVLTNTDPSSALAATEIFGPVAAIQTFTDLDDAIGRANATDWGLVGYVATQDIDNALNVAERLDVGMVGHQHRRRVHPLGAVRWGEAVRSGP